jgi:hypothetical protein
MHAAAWCGRGPLGLAERHWVGPRAAGRRSVPACWRPGRCEKKGDRFQWEADVWADAPAYPTAPPPAPQAEPPQRPRAGYVWIAGNYEWKDGDYAWTPGHWERQKASQRWVDGHWDRQGDRYVWIPGAWQ